MSEPPHRPDGPRPVDGLDPSVLTWLGAFAERLGVDPPTADEVEVLLSLAGTAARASARQAAPVACWLAARANVDLAAALDLAGSVEID